MQVHHAINSAISYATHELSTRCEKILRDSVFQAISALQTRSTTDLPPLTLAALPVPPSTRDDVSVSPTILLTISYVSLLKSLLQPMTTSTAALVPGDLELLRILSLYTGRPGSTFTSENQKLLLSALLKNEYESVLAVLPTGSGKSIAIFGPILARNTGQDSVSVVITCYTALRRQLAEQARAFGIKFLLWNERSVDGSPSCTSVQLVIMITDDVYQEEAKS